nr:hypothetical protein GCM10020063_054340 [Dactylosporangium thailandense]
MTSPVSLAASTSRVTVTKRARQGRRSRNSRDPRRWAGTGSGEVTGAAGGRGDPRHPAGLGEELIQRAHA